ncbi:MAG TPA: AMMECR1 domain-containing protein [Peptococcaceae bacterium]|nr:MAG: AMMECR1 domain protein [Clostridia bacterium 41_269]HBT20926.1 AMMECR1 domain-containing protein [Peptococcaceae bacterium]
MGRLIHGSLLPHPPIIIPEVGGTEIFKAGSTFKGMQAAADSIAKRKPDVLVVISPHAPVFPDRIAVNQVPILRGSLRQFGAYQVECREENDLELGKKIIQKAEEKNIPVVELGPEYLRESFSTEILDHGIMVPLYFIRKAGLNCPIVPISISFLPLEEIYLFGIAVREAIEESSRNAAVVASGDMSHRLSSSGPYGYDPAGKVFDEKIVQSILKADPMILFEMSEDFVERAGQCGLRPLVMLFGSMDGFNIKSIVHSYEGPFGVGYVVAELLPEGENKKRGFLSRLFADAEQFKKEGYSYPVKLAWKSLKSYLLEGKIIPVPEDIPDELKKPAGAFVSLKKRGQLRGCIGTFRPTRKNAAEEIIMNAISAATQDPRFPPVSPEELDELEITVDILKEPQPVRDLSELDPKKYGIIVKKGMRRGLLLPDIEGVNTVQEQLRIAKEKAGISPFEDCEIEKFEVVRYK